MQHSRIQFFLFKVPILGIVFEMSREQVFQI